MTFFCLSPHNSFRSKHLTSPLKTIAADRGFCIVYQTKKNIIMTNGISFLSLPWPWKLNMHADTDRQGTFSFRKERNFNIYLLKPWPPSLLLLGFLARRRKNWLFDLIHACMHFILFSHVIYCFLPLWPNSIRKSWKIYLLHCVLIGKEIGLGVQVQTDGAQRYKFKGGSW